MSLAESGRARLALSLPRHRAQLRNAEGREIAALFEQYALAAITIDNLRRHRRPPGEMVHMFHGLCLDIQAEVVRKLGGPAATG
ncbi:hypothetical protein [Rhizobium halophytocola]|uniref:Uncharacterized protein n=1 Tax=Rhizobium halophytocola TaxID=735519 RepID=A0ABS4E658_9HYPH|nr:hypothetical protein [Rhizobium halophytocola]MBP1853403.1 hypothetical protein [Rhizobium halophytocola]